MNNIIFEDERTLSPSETIIMKAIWDYIRKNESDISVPDLIEELHKYGKDYARTTIVTFLLKLSDKGFVRTYRKGKLSYVRVVKDEEEYKEKLMRDDINFWYDGNIDAFMAVLNRILKK